MNWLNEKDCREFLSKSAVIALINEATLTPKPGLVDKSNTGSHTDMNVELMIKSAASLKETFAGIAAVAYNKKPSQQLRECIAKIGREGEQTMLQTTGGVNTHKGAIWTLGLLTAASAINDPGASHETLARTAGEIACFEDRYTPFQSTNGKKVIERYKVDGAKGQAQKGFPHVVNIGFPALQYYRSLDNSEECSLIYSLISIMAELNDTCILHRGGQTVLVNTKSMCKKIIEQGGPATTNGWETLLKLDRYLIVENASPGGSADLLAAVLYIDDIILNQDCLSKKNNFQLA